MLLIVRLQTACPVPRHAVHDSRVLKDWLHGDIGVKMVVP
jgi:hypothetical protein